MKNETKRSRIEYFDYLRIAASFAVMVIHVVILHWFHLDVNSGQWLVFTFFSGITRWCVPVFLMMSGALFVGGRQSIGIILKKNAFRLLTALVFWSGLYALRELALNGASLGQALTAFVLGHFHLWFVYTILGLYLAVPLLRKVAESEETLRYFLAAALVCTVLVPRAAACLGLFSRTGEHLLATLLNQIDYSAGTYCAFYFLWGYFLHTREIAPVWRKRICILGILGAIATCGLTAAVSVWKQEATDVFLAYNSLSVLCTSTAVFVFAKHHLSYGHLSRKGIAVVQDLSRCSFGAYLAHILVLDALMKVLPRGEGNAALFILGVSALVFILSMGVSWLLHRIPVLKTYIV